VGAKPGTGVGGERGRLWPPNEQNQRKETGDDRPTNAPGGSRETGKSVEIVVLGWVLEVEGGERRESAAVKGARI